MTVLVPFPAKNAVYNQTIVTVSSPTAITSPSISAGALPPGLSLTSTSTTLSITGTPTTVGTYSFTVAYSTTNPSSSYSLSYTTQVILAPIAAPNPLRWSDLSTWTGQTINVRMGSNRIRLLANNVIDSTEVRLSSCYNKPVAGTDSQASAGSKPFTVPVYQALVVQVSGAGGGGCFGEETQLQNGVCVSIDGSAFGTAGSNSSSLGLISYGGAGGQSGQGSAAFGGNNQNALLGGGSAGGAGINGPGCAFNPGQRGGDGGFCDVLNVIASGTIEYNSSFTLTAGSGGIGGKSAGDGIDGTVVVIWA